MHYNRWRHRGAPEVIPTRYLDREAGFWAKVDRAGPVPAQRPDLGPCWVWTAATNRKGYGMFGDGERGSVGAHRWAWVQAHGPIPADLVPDHLCRNPPCVNPAHLELVTGGENSLRGNTFAAANAAKTHCKWGHALTPENSYGYKGRRQCKTCARNRARGLRPTGELR